MEDSQVHAFESRVERSWPPEHWSPVGVLVAVSGGPDSVALLRALASLGAKRPGGVLVAAHFNHHLRGEESDADEAFVADLARRLELPLEKAGATASDWTTGADGMEAAARAARYRFLERAAAKWGTRFVATGHTADDQAETILHRILRGTGIAGLAGMARARPLGPAATLLRPLLEIRRCEVLAYLDALGQPFRRDSSNDDTRWTRNRIRHGLLPQLAADFNPAVVEALLRLGRLAGEVQAVISPMAGDLADRAVQVEPGGEVRIALSPLASQTPYVVREVLMAVWRLRDWPLQAMGLDEWDQLASMVLAPAEPPRKRTFPGGISAELTSDALVLRESRSR